MTFDHHRRCQHEMYRMTCAEFDALFEYAEGCCQICKTPEAETKAGKLLIDHAKDYGYHAVRGLVCDKCNALMRRVDNCEKTDARVWRYRYDAWFVRVLRDRERAARASRREALRELVARHADGG